MKLQIALDELTIEEGLALCEQVRDFIDIIEIGTPFIIREGMHAVRAFREHFPEKEILADAKIMDGGSMETRMCIEAGADYVTVLGVTDLLTVKECVETAKQYDKTIVIDMICVDDLAGRTRQLEQLGVCSIAVHTGVDQQKAGRTPLADLIELKKCTSRSEISVAGGISLDTIDEYVKAGADICIVGGGIAHANDPAVAARALADVIHQQRTKETDNSKRESR